MSFVSWNKLTLAELKELCLTCGLTSGGNKKELGERLHAFFEKRKGKQPDSEFVAGEMSHDPYIDTEGAGNEFSNCGDRVFEREGIADLEEDCVELNSQFADDNIRDTLAAGFQRQEQRCHPEEIEEGDLLNEAWPTVKLTKARDQHEYDFLSKMGDKDFICIRDDMESRAVMLRLANEKGWKTALQIVGNNDKMMEKGREMGFMTLPHHQTLTTKVPLGKIEREVKGYTPFEVEKTLSPQIVPGESPVLTVEVLAISQQTALQQMRSPSPEPKRKIDYTQPQAMGLVEIKSSETGNPPVGLCGVVADTNAYTSRPVSASTSTNNIHKGSVRSSRTIEKPRVVFSSNKSKLVSKLLVKAQSLFSKAFSRGWNNCLDKAWSIFLSFCKITKQKALPSSVNTLVSCLIWLDLTHAFAKCTDILAAVSKEHLNAQFPDPSKAYKRFISIRPKTSENCPLFLSRQGKQLTVSAIGAIVKRLAKHSGLEGCYTAHSIRIGGATAAMEAGLSLTQIRAIGSWDSKAVMLYLTLVGTTQMQVSRKM
ncbi:9545_t:CDS:2, partial [Cetraspora pellucida]